MSSFKNWSDNRHEYAREWKKKTGGKVLGYFCTYLPEEILYAADVLPVRIFGQHGTDIGISSAHIYDMYCPFSRSCLAEGLKGKYDYLDGVAIAQSCMHIRQAFWSWQKHLPVEYSYYIYMPHGVQSKGRYKYYRGELVEFKESLEKWLGKNITDADLDKGIDIVRKNKESMRKIWEFRKNDRPAITGLEAMEIVFSSQVIDKREHNEALQQLITELPDRKVDRETGTRLMIIGSEDDDREFTKMVEEGLSLPATFVIEDHCVGSRYFWNEFTPDEDRLASIVRWYLDRPPCPSKDWPKRLRFSHIKNLIQEYKVEAAILMQQKFCDPHELDIPALKKYLDGLYIPHYLIEFDVLVPAGQLKTRVEAFLETRVELV